MKITLQNFLTICLIVMFGLFLYKTSPTSVSAKNNNVGTITGQVQLLGPGAPFQAGVRVIIEGTDLYGETDVNGYYTITNVPVGQFYTIIPLDIPTGQAVNVGGLMPTNDEGPVQAGVYVPGSNDVVTIPLLTILEQL